jgi:hypothetical protein
MAIRFSRIHNRARAFTLLEVALIVAIIGMMLMIIVGYLLAPKQSGPLPPVPESTPIPSSVPPSPAPSTSKGTVITVPATTPSPGLNVVPASPAASNPSPGPSFR